MRQLACAMFMAVAAASVVAATTGDGGRQTVGSDPGAALPGEWFVTGASGDVLGAAEAVVRALGARVARRDAARGVLITRDANYGAAWPGREGLDLPPTQSPASATLHVHVAPGWSPVRLAVGAILTTTTTATPLQGRKARGETVMFSHRPLAAAVATLIAQRLGATLVPMPADAEARAREATRLGDRQAAACGPATLIPQDTAGQLPTLVSEVRPMYPRPELERRRGGAVVVRAEVTEHGTLTGMSWAQGVEDANLVAATFGAAGLWRFSAPVVGQCQARRQIMIEMSFALRRP